MHAHRLTILSSRITNSADLTHVTPDNTHTSVCPVNRTWRGLSLMEIREKGEDGKRDWGVTQRNTHKQKGQSFVPLPIPCKINTVHPGTIRYWVNSSWNWNVGLN